ncbi:MAG: hypothetical protein HXX20_20755 [Chloroflexi bacterium]|nr:hypothetical protein [Chloroflexota bacterium]
MSDSKKRNPQKPYKGVSSALVEGEHSPALQAVLLEAVDNQIAHLNPPEVKATFDRLRSEGFSEEDARRLIGAILVSEVFDILKNDEPYNEARYVAALNRLPKMPWD